MSQTAIIYARFSTSEQSKGYSLERQKTHGLEFAALNEWAIEKTISDEGRSAFHGANRLEGSALHEFELEARNDLHQGKVLVVENIDRLSRQGAKAAAQLIWGLNGCGVDVATYQDKHIYRASASEDMLDIFKLIIIAQQGHEESKNKSKRTTATWEKRFAGMREGTHKDPIPHTPNWIDRIDGKLVLNEHRTALLNEIYDLYIDGSGIHRIVTMLNERGEPSWTPVEHDKHVNGWFYGAIWRLLTKRAVMGEYVSMDGTTISPDFYPQAITAEKWNRAQATLSMRKSNQKRGRNLNRNLLQQIVVCGDCGGGAHFVHTTDNVQTYTKVNGEVVNYRRKTYRRLRCDSARRKHECDNNTVLNYDVVEATVLNELLPRLVEKPTDNEAALKLRQQIAELIRLKDTNQSRLDNLIDAVAEGQSKGMMARIASLETEIDNQATEIAAKQKQLAVETSKPSNDDDVALIESLRAELLSEDEDIRVYARGRVNMSLRRLLKRIVINANGTFTIQPDGHSWWQFDGEGMMLEGEYALT